MAKNTDISSVLGASQNAGKVRDTEEAPVKYTTCSLRTDLHRLLKIRAAQEGKEVRELLAELLEPILKQ